MQRCTRCVLPETHETIVFDNEGVCNICRQHEHKRNQIDWGAAKVDFDRIVGDFRGRGEYDCIVPFSGGKDSTWTLYYLVKECGLRPLVVSFDHGFMRPKVLENAKRTIRQLGVAYHSFTPNWKVVQRLMLQSFLEKGDFCWHCHTGIFAYPMWVALRYEIPLVIWGEPSAEYTAYYRYGQAEEVDEKRFNRFVNLGMTAEDMLVRLEGSVDQRDLQPFTYPPLRDLRKIGYRSICLGSFVSWDVKAQVSTIERELGWEGDEVENVPPGYNYDKIECQMQGVRDYIKFIKRGYTRPSHLTSIDIRNDRLSRDDALAIVDKYEGMRPPSLDRFLEYVGLSEPEFVEVAKSHRVSPWLGEDDVPVELGQKPPDFDQWCRAGAMEADDAEAQLERWRRQGKPRSMASEA